MCRTGWLALAAGTVALHLLCTNAPVTGPSTEEGNPQIVAVVVDSLRQPVPGAIVTAYRIPLNVDTLREPLEPMEIAQGKTDTSGRCSFNNLMTGFYSIQAAITTQQAMKSGIEIDDSYHRNQIDTLTLGSPGAISGVVSRGGVPGNVTNQQLKDGVIQVIIQEIRLSATTPDNGTYLFDSLPPGTYTLLYYASDGFYSAKRTVNVTAGNTTPVNTVILKPVPRLLPPKGFTAVYDSIAGLVHLSWQKVNYDSLRWYEVLRYDLAGPYDDTLCTVDTFVVDSVNSIPSGTELTYVIRTIDRALNTSDNAGPQEVKVR